MGVAPAGRTEPIGRRAAGGGAPPGGARRRRSVTCPPVPAAVPAAAMRGRTWPGERRRAGPGRAGAVPVPVPNSGLYPQDRHFLPVVALGGTVPGAAAALGCAGACSPLGTAAAAGGRRAPSLGRAAPRLPAG